MESGVAWDDPSEDLLHDYPIVLDDDADMATIDEPHDVGVLVASS